MVEIPVLELAMKLKVTNENEKMYDLGATRAKAWLRAESEMKLSMSSRKDVWR